MYSIWYTIPRPILPQPIMATRISSPRDSSSDSVCIIRFIFPTFIIHNRKRNLKTRPIEGCILHNPHLRRGAPRRDITPFLFLIPWFEDSLPRSNSSDADLSFCAGFRSVTSSSRISTRRRELPAAPYSTRQLCCGRRFPPQSKLPELTSPAPSPLKTRSTAISEKSAPLFDKNFSVFPHREEIDGQLNTSSLLNAAKAARRSESPPSP